MALASTSLHNSAISAASGRRHAAMLQLLLVFSGIWQPLLVGWSWLRHDGLIDPWVPWLAGVGTLANWTWLLLLRRGWYDVAARGFVLASLLLLTVAYVRWGLELQMRTQLAQLVPVLIGGFLLERRTFWWCVCWMQLTLLLGAWQDAAQSFFLDSRLPQVLENLALASVGFLVVAFVLDRSMVALRDSLDVAHRRGQELARKRDRLQLEIREKERSREQLVHAVKMENVGRLASGVAHDFNHLLALILAYVGKGRRSDDGDGLRAALDGVEAATRRATAVTRRLLDFSRDDVAERSLFDPVAALTEMGPVLRQLFDSGVEVQLRSSGGACRILFDRAQLELILISIAANANQAMPEGGRFELVMTLLSHSPELEILARDTGMGMSEEVRRQCLQPFFTTKPTGQGTGLGLAVAANLINASGGSISVDSAAGSGSTFRIRLPAQPPPLEIADD